MKNVLISSVVAFGLVGCGGGDSKHVDVVVPEVVAPVVAPVVDMKILQISEYLKISTEETETICKTDGFSCEYDQYYDLENETVTGRSLTIKYEVDEDQNFEFTVSRLYEEDSWASVRATVFLTKNELLIFPLDSLATCSFEYDETIRDADGRCDFNFREVDFPAYFTYDDLVKIRNPGVNGNLKANLNVKYRKFATEKDEEENNTNFTIEYLNKSIEIDYEENQEPLNIIFDLMIEAENHSY